MVFLKKQTFSATGMLWNVPLNFSLPLPIMNDTIVDITFSIPIEVNPGNYPITIIATAATVSKEVTHRWSNPVIRLLLNVSTAVAHQWIH